MRETAHARGADETATGQVMNGRQRYHPDDPHVVRISGGRSSATITLRLLENGALDAGRGDLVVFNNTGAEAPATYAFVRRIRARVEAAQIPSPIGEFATAEVRHHGRWTRTPTYRLVNERPRSAANPHGFDQRGIVYEELLSWSGYTPTYFQRTCTSELKIRSTRRMMDDWLTDTERPEAIGDAGAESRIDPDIAHAVHRRAGGQRTRDEFMAVKRFVWSRPPMRGAQRFDAFSAPAGRIASGRGRRAQLARRVGRRRRYVSVIGLRDDEGECIMRIHERVGRDSVNDEQWNVSETAWMPLEDAGITRADVDAFWRGRGDDLDAPEGTALSNCAYCLPKRGEALRELHAYLENGGRCVTGTPSDWRWWATMESKYGRTLSTGPALPRGSTCYASVIDPDPESERAGWGMPCDCTE